MSRQRYDHGRDTICWSGHAWLRGLAGKCGLCSGGVAGRRNASFWRMSPSSSECESSKADSSVHIVASFSDPELSRSADHVAAMVVALGATINSQQM